jgi:hypothetical protein
MRSRTIVAICVAAAVVVIGVAGAAAVALWPSKPAGAVEAEVVGDWRGNDGAGITLRADHTFDAHQLRLRLKSTDPDATFTGSGTWQLATRSTYEPQRVRLFVDGYGDALYVDKSSSRVRLFQWIGDPDADDRYWLDR